jgi:hypothetical protein
VIRNIASRVTGTAISTGRFAVNIPLGVARTVVSHVPFVGGKHDSAQPASAEPTPATGAEEAVADRAPEKPVEDLATAESKPAKAPPAKKPRAAAKVATPKAGEVQHAEGKPDVVLAVDTPPEVIEPPVDVVGEALAAEQAEEARKPKQPQPVHVEDEHPVVYSSGPES